MTGIVYLVGAGPGDPELITIRGLKCLQKADVVAYDRLVHPDLLQEAPPYARLVNVGKAPGRHRYSQGEINALLIQEARAGQIVVRLKGGDPFVFGRGGEEALALVNARIPFEVVPGISSAVAAPAFAGIPVTHRHVARSFTVVTGHTAGSDECDLNWQALAALDTLVFLMGVRTLPRIARSLIEHGREAQTPVAVISCGTTETQRVVQDTLANIAEQAAHLPSPATIVVGEVARFQESLTWFSSPQAQERFEDIHTGVPAEQLTLVPAYAEVVLP